MHTLHKKGASIYFILGHISSTQSNASWQFGWSLFVEWMNEWKQEWIDRLWSPLKSEAPPTPAFFPAHSGSGTPNNETSPCFRILRQSLSLGHRWGCLDSLCLLQVESRRGKQFGNVFVILSIILLSVAQNLSRIDFHGPNGSEHRTGHRVY